MPARSCVAGWLVGLLLPAGAMAADLEWPSCIDGSPPLRVPAGTAKALLDQGDRQVFEHAARARFPLYDSGRRAAAQVVLLRRGGGWQYLALWEGGPTGLCLAAAFAAEGFDATPGWLAKYRPQPDTTLDD